MEKSLISGTPWKGILSFMFPVFMGLLLQQFYNTADTIIVGNFFPVRRLWLPSAPAAF